MPEFSEANQDKIDALRVRYHAGETIKPFELLAIEWPDGTIYYSVLQTDEITSPAPPVSPIEARLVPEDDPAWFLPIVVDSTIGDEELDLEMWDADEVVSQLLITHGEGVKCIAYYWFPQEELLLEFWHGHLRFEDEAAADIIKLKAVQGFRSADVNVPGRAHYQNCNAVFGGLFATNEEAAEYGPDCPYDLNRGGSIGTNDPATGLPWTYCTREDHQSCIDRGVDPLFHLSHRTIRSTVWNFQSHGPNLLTTSQGNETNLKNPVRVVMGERRIHGMPVMAFARQLNNNDPDHGWFNAMYEAGEGPLSSFSQVRVTVGGGTHVVSGNLVQHYNFRLGNRGQTNTDTELTSHGYSGTAFIRYRFGYINPANISEGDASASALTRGLNDIRTYTAADTYSTGWTSNRAWQLARILTDKRWGYGYDYDRLDIDSFIDAADWCNDQVRFIDTFGTRWDHIRSDSHPELIGKKVQQQVEDLCMAGRLSRPFLFNGKIHVVPLRALNTGLTRENVPIFTDEGDTDRNIIREDNKSTLTVSRKSDLDLINRVECTFDDAANDWLETPLSPVEDIDAQLRAGRVVGDRARKINTKKFPLLGVTNRNQAMKMAWSILDLGPFDEGGLQNNLTAKFTTWFMDTLDLHQEKVIKIASSRLTKYGFSYFRIKQMKRLSNLHVEIECQAYNSAYMDTFERPIGIGGGGDDSTMVVSGGGTTAMNGTWNRMGTTTNGYPWYRKGEYITQVVWNVAAEVFQWRMNGTTYVGPSDVDASPYPWDETWYVGSGAAPAPTVTAGAPSPDPIPDPIIQCNVNDFPCPPGMICVGGVCIAAPPPCRPTIGDTVVESGILRVMIVPCND